MSSSCETPSEVQPVVAALQARGLALPAWMLLESIRPFHWLLGQACLVGQPLAHILGLGTVADRAISFLDDPRAIDSLCQALAPQESEE